MAEVTGIAWCDHTFNPWIGCQKVSPACDHCYAETQDVRFHGGVHWGPGAPRRRTTDAYWRAPLLWHRKAKAAGVRRRVFCASSADVFDNAVPETWRQDLWALIAATPALDWLLLTKRPQNSLTMLPANWGGGWPSVWLGTSVENEVERRRRVPVLLTVPARIRFLSCEPLLEPVDLAEDLASGALHWIIVGGESGRGRRPMLPGWPRSLRDQCAAAEIPFFFKQWGAKAPGDDLLDGTLHHEWPASDTR
jgi:protein gp37